MRFWHLLAAISGSIVTLAMALASVSYNATLGSVEPAFRWLPLLQNAHVFSALALAFDLAMVASVFAFLEWRRRSPLRACICAILFLIASAFSVHSVRGYIAANITRALAPSERHHDLYLSLRRELADAQALARALDQKRIGAGRRTARRLARERNALAQRIDEIRKRLAKAPSDAPVRPLPGLDWFLAFTLWFFNATCWAAWFGRKNVARPQERGVTQPAARDSVRRWLQGYSQNEPEHCRKLYRAYAAWCTSVGLDPLGQYSFYARLRELGARKLRKGRNAPVLYALPRIKDATRSHNAT